MLPTSARISLSELGGLSLGLTRGSLMMASVAWLRIRLDGSSPENSLAKSSVSIWSLDEIEVAVGVGIGIVVVVVASAFPVPKEEKQRDTRQNRRSDLHSIQMSSS
jgi:hypothetical protein